MVHAKLHKGFAVLASMARGARRRGGVGPTPGRPQQPELLFFKAATFLSIGTTLSLMLEDWSSSSIPTREGPPGFRWNFDKECLHYTLELSHPEERDHILSVVLHDTGAQPSRLRSPEVKSQDFSIQPRHLCYAAKQSRYLTKRFRIKEEPALQRTGSTSFDIANTIYARLLTVKELN